MFYSKQLDSNITNVYPAYLIFEKYQDIFTETFPNYKESENEQSDDSILNDIVATVLQNSNITKDSPYTVFCVSQFNFPFEFVILKIKDNNLKTIFILLNLIHRSDEYTYTAHFEFDTPLIQNKLRYENAGILRKRDNIITMNTYGCFCEFAKLNNMSMNAKVNQVMLSYLDKSQETETPFNDVENYSWNFYFDENKKFRLFRKFHYMNLIILLDYE